MIRLKTKQVPVARALQLCLSMLRGGHVRVSFPPRVRAVKNRDEECGLGCRRLRPVTCGTGFAREGARRETLVVQPFAQPVFC